VLVIPPFQGLANASTSAFGGTAANVVVVREDVDAIGGDDLALEAGRVARGLLGAAR
jgi:hypothetical protein